MKRAKFDESQFRSTEFNTAAQKARFLNLLVKFVVDGFPETGWTKYLYNHLYLHMGYIAHYNMCGFWDAQFSTPDKRLAFIEYHGDRRGLGCSGNPEFTWSDVGRAFAKWVQEEKVLEELRVQYGVQPPQFDKKTFRVATMSSNTGAFGHNQFLLIAKDGEAWRVQHIQSNGYWGVGQMILVPRRDGEPQWSAVCVECPEQMETAPKNVVDQVWAADFPQNRKKKCS